MLTVFVRMMDLIQWMQVHNVYRFRDVPPHIFDEIKGRFPYNAEERVEYPNDDFILLSAWY